MTAAGRRRWRDDDEGRERLEVDFVEHGWILYVRGIRNRHSSADGRSF